MFEQIATDLRTFDVSGLTRHDLCDVTAGIAKVRGALDSLEIRVAAAVDELGDNGGNAEAMMRSEGGMSQREARRRRQRAERLAKMPNTAEKLAHGELTTEHADQLAKAAEATSEELVDSDERLLANAARRPADLAGRDIRDWTALHQSTSDREERHRQQRQNRSLSFFTSDDHMRIAMCRSDDVTGEQLARRVEELARRLHRQDLKTGANTHATEARSWEQLRHDALMILLGIDNTKTVPNEGNDGTVDGCVCGRRRGRDLTVDDLLRPAGVRNQILAVADIDAISRRDPNARMEIPGSGPIPRSVLDRLACDAEIFGLIFNGSGLSLWHGQATRTVSPQQWRALLARDRACVICAAHPAYCEAHHIIEWLDLGPTDIENLALLCVRHHHQIHDQGLMLIRDGPGQWRITPKPPDPRGRRNRAARYPVAV